VGTAAADHACSDRGATRPAKPAVELVLQLWIPGRCAGGARPARVAFSAGRWAVVRGVGGLAAGAVGRGWSSPGVGGCARSLVVVPAVGRDRSVLAFWGGGHLSDRDEVAGGRPRGVLESVRGAWSWARAGRFGPEAPSVASNRRYMRVWRDSPMSDGRRCGWVVVWPVGVLRIAQVVAHGRRRCAPRFAGGRPWALCGGGRRSSGGV
jgi:hypothetical protein